MGRFVCAALVAAVCASAASANAGPPWIGGRVVTEPVLKGARITGETLVIDLRPVARGEFADVEAAYRFTTVGFGPTSREIELVFVTGVNDFDSFAVTCDGAPVATHLIAGAPLFESWKPPAHTPGLDGAPLSYHPRLTESQHKFVAFTLSVAAGDHELNVKYRAPASKNLSGHPVAYQQFAYVLAPAKAWDGFGKLDVTVHLPEGWSSASEPALTRDGNTLRGTFDGIPADALALTLQAPAGRGYAVAQIVLWGVFGVLCLVLAWLAWRIGRALGRRGNVWAILGIGFVFVCVAHVAIVVGLTAAQFGPERALPEHLVGGQGGAWAVFAAMLVAPLFVVPVYGGIVWGTGLVVRHLNRPVPPAT